MKVTVIVEGGTKGDLTACRRAFRGFLEAAGLTGRLPKVVPAGARSKAYQVFRSNVSKSGDDEAFVLLVDSEGPLDAREGKWDHVRRSPAGWRRPDGADEDDLHFMVQSMESWLLADTRALKHQFPSADCDSSIPKRPLEEVPKKDLLKALNDIATDAGQRDGYSKNRHSWAILEAGNLRTVADKCPHARRFLDCLERRCQPGSTS